MLNGNSTDKGPRAHIKRVTVIRLGHHWLHFIDIRSGDFVDDDSWPGGVVMRDNRTVLDLPACRWILVLSQENCLLIGRYKPIFKVQISHVLGDLPLRLISTWITRRGRSYDGTKRGLPSTCQNQASLLNAVFRLWTFGVVPDEIFGQLISPYFPFPPILAHASLGSA